MRATAAAPARDTAGFANDAPTTASAITAISGRYIRRSAPTSVAIGTMLDVGASVTKNHSPRNPKAGRHTIAAAAAVSSAVTSKKYGNTSPRVTGPGHP